MGYAFLVVDTKSLLAYGSTNEASRIHYIFTRLMDIQKCVILFDKIEEFALNQ